MNSNSFPDKTAHLFYHAAKLNIAADTEKILVVFRKKPALIETLAIETKVAETINHFAQAKLNGRHPHLC